MGRLLYQQIARRIMNNIVLDSHSRVDDQLPSVRELSDRYLTSGNTIMSALGYLEQQGFVEKIAGSGCYIRQKSAREDGAETKLIGLILPTRAYEISARYYDGVREICRREGYHVLVGDTDWCYEREREEIDSAIQAGCQAVILVPTARMQSQLDEDYLKTEYRDFPIVLMDVASSEQGRSLVVFDNFRVGYDVTTYLISKGHRHIAFMDYSTPQGDYMHFPERERLRGYHAALRNAGIEPRDEDCWRYFDPGHDTTCKEESLLRKWVEQTDRPTAVLAREDSTAMRVISIAMDLGIRIPRDLEVAGFDNLSSGRLFRPRFATTNPDNERAAQIATEIALQHIRGEIERPVTYILPVAFGPLGPVLDSCEHGDGQDRRTAVCL